METTTKTATIEHFQTGGADETEAEVRSIFMKRNPNAFIVSSAFEYAYPGRPGDGRTVGIKITYKMPITG